MNFLSTQKIKHLIIVSCTLITIFLLITKFFKRDSAKKGITIGILQTISHPALNKAKEGFIKELSLLMDNQVNFIVQNAEGSSITAQTIAQSFHNNSKINSIFTIGTLALQATFKSEKEKPIIFCAVTDPLSLGIDSKTNICGVTDLVDVNISAQTIKELFPEIKSIALIFNPSEINSVSLVKKMSFLLNQIKVTPIQVGVNNESEISTAIMMAARKADALWIPTDNTLANAINIIGRLALKEKKPLFICDNLLLTDGTLASCGGVDYVLCGKRAANLAKEILQDQQTPSQIGIVNPPTNSIFIYKTTFNLLDIKLPENFKSQIKWIEK